MHPHLGCITSLNTYTETEKLKRQFAQERQINQGSINLQDHLGIRKNLGWERSQELQNYFYSFQQNNFKKLEEKKLYS